MKADTSEHQSAATRLPAEIGAAVVGHVFFNQNSRTHTANFFEEKDQAEVLAELSQVSGLSLEVVEQYAPGIFGLLTALQQTQPKKVS